MRIVFYTKTRSLTYNTKTTKKTDGILEHTLYVTSLGSIGIFVILLYIYNKYGTLNCYYLSKTGFMRHDLDCFFILILYWFYGKISIIFLYCEWIYGGTEFSSDYSLFLSGILILSILVILYCLYMLMLSLRLGLIMYLIHIMYN